jgi:ferritin
MNPDIISALKEQHTLERQNAAAYDALAAQADVINWPGLESWCAKSANEERDHAAKIAAYLVDRNQTPTFEALEAASAPTSGDHADFFRAAMAREIMTTEHINEIYDMCCEAKEFDVCRRLLWFLEEQTKSEREITDYLLMLARPIDRLVFDQSLK